MEDPVGKTVKLWGDDRQIIGVVKDFNFESLYSEIKPCFFRLVDTNFNSGANIWVKIRTGVEQETIARINKLYHELNPGLDFEFKFLDNDFQAWMSSDRGPIRIHLARFTTFDAPRQAIEPHGGVFKPISEMRGLPMIELNLLRQVFNLIMGGG